MKILIVRCLTGLADFDMTRSVASQHGGGQS